MAQLFDSQAVAVTENKFDWIDKGINTGIDYAKARSQIDTNRAIIEAKRIENDLNKDIMAQKSMESDMESIRDIYATTNPKMKNIKIKLFEERKKIQGKPVSPIFKEIMNDDTYMESFKQLDELLKDPDVINQPGKLFQLHKELNSIYGSERADSIFNSIIEANTEGALAGKAVSEAIYKDAMTELAKVRAEKEGANVGLIEAKTGLTEKQAGLTEAKTGVAQEQVETQKAKTDLTKSQAEATQAGIGQKDKALELKQQELEVKKDWQVLMKERYADLDENDKKRLALQDKKIEADIKTNNKRLEITEKATAARASKASGIPAGTVKGYVDKLGTKGEASKRSDKYRAQIDASTAALNDFKKRRSKDSLMAVTAALASAYGMGSGRALSDKDIEMLQSSTGLNDLSQLKAYVMNDTQNVLNSKVFDNMDQALRNSIETSK